MKYFNLIIVCLSLFSCTSEFSKGKYVIDTIHPVITLDRYEKEFDLQDLIVNWKQARRVCWEISIK